jgi:regulator of sirC expression with transglutaminase-like and TPR domain
MNCTEALHLLADDPSAPLDAAEVALLLAADEYPDLDISGYLSRLEDMADRLRPRLHGSLEQHVRRLSSFLFDDECFTGNADEYYDPRNSYLNDVIDRRLGIPITLSVVAISIGQRAGLDVAGVGLPGHFIAKAVEGDAEVLFDPFHGGQILAWNDCERLVRSVTERPFALTRAALEPTPLGVLVMRMLNNLKQIYVQTQDFDRAARVIERQRQLDPRDMSLRRDLGVTMVQANQFAPALEHLKAYLDAVPAADDHADVKQLFRRVRAEVARWN